jgi:hypothetical protein
MSRLGTRRSSMCRSWYHVGVVPAARAPLPAAIALIWISVALVGFGCARGAATSPVGVSTAEPDREPSARPEAPRVRWPDYAAAQTWPEAGPPSIALEHRRDGSLIQVRVEASALAAYRGLTVEAPMPEGARVMASLKSPRGAPLGSYLLEKRGGSWSAIELDAEGGVIPGDRGDCLRCHALAPTDHLFGLPRAAVAAPAGGEESLAPAVR